MSCGIYEIICIETGKIYIGSSKDIERRWMEHINALYNKSHVNKYLQKAWNKYGEDNFEFQILEECQEHILLKREQYYLDLYEPYKELGYNLSDNASRPSNSKRYTVLSPDGVEYEITGICNFSIAQGFCRSGLHEVTTGKVTHCGGWKAKKSEQTWEEWEANKKCSNKRERWRGKHKLIYNDGTEEIIDSFCAIIKERGWAYGPICNLRCGMAKSAYGIINIEKV